MADSSSLQAGTTSRSADPWANDDTAQIEDSRAVRAHVDVWGEEIAPANTIPALPKEAISASIWGEEINSEASTVKASPSTNTVSLPKGLSSLQEAEDRAPKNLEASKIVQERNAWGVDSNAVEEEQEVLQTISSAWADDNVDSNLAATTTSTTAQNDNWITLSVRSSNGSSFANAGADRRSPSGRGRGGGRGRGRGGSYTNYNNDDYRQRSGSSSFRPPVNEALRPRSTNQMYQAPDNCWQARTQSNLPNTSASSPRNVFLANNNNQSYISHASTSPAAQQSSFTHASQDVSYHLTNQGSMRSPQMMSDAQTPRQACIPTIVDMYGRSISLHHEGSNDNERLRETNNSTPSLTISDNNPGKSPWDD